MDTPTSAGALRLTRRQLVSGMLAGVAALGVAACARRTDVPAPPAATAAPPPTTPAATGASATGATAAAGAPQSAAGPPKRGGMLMAATQTDWITFDNIYNSANG